MYMYFKSKFIYININNFFKKKKKKKDKQIMRYKIL